MELLTLPDAFPLSQQMGRGLEASPQPPSNRFRGLHTRAIPGQVARPAWSPPKLLLHCVCETPLLRLCVPVNKTHASPFSCSGPTKLPFHRQGGSERDFYLGPQNKSAAEPAQNLGPWLKRSAQGLAELRPCPREGVVGGKGRQG